VVEPEIVVCAALAVIQQKWIVVHGRPQWTVRLVAENRHHSMGPKQRYWMLPPILPLALPYRETRGNGFSWQKLQHRISSYYSAQRGPRELRILIDKIVSASAEYTNDQTRTRYVFTLTCTTVPDQAPDGKDDECSGTKRRRNNHNGIVRRGLLLLLLLSTGHGNSISCVGLMGRGPRGGPGDDKRSFESIIGRSVIQGT